MAMKSPDDDHPRPIRDLLRRLIKAPAALSVIWPALLVVGGYFAWHQWGADHVAERFYGVDATLIRINPAPDYVRSEVVKSVYRDTAMEGLSLLDPQATAKIASAFSMHPWIRRVVSVRKMPGGVVDVHVQYRKPVAMVLVEKPNATDQGEYFFPVDGEGVLLPPNEFARAETMQFIHIVVPGAYATGLAGSPFGDARVEAAARLAAVLEEYREEAGIVSIDVPGDPRLNRTPELELTTSEILAGGETVGRKRFWGSPPGAEMPWEPTTEIKLKTLLNSTAAEHADLRVVGRARPIIGSPDRGDTITRPASSRVAPPAKTPPGVQTWRPDGQRVEPLP